MTTIPREAREGLMRAWLEILKERHPEVTWVARPDSPAEEEGAAELARESPVIV